MSDRYFVTEPVHGDRATLSGPEAHHAIHVMRAKPGDRLTLFDGSGAEFEAQVAGARRDRVELDVIERREVNRELDFAVTLGVALPKGDRQRWLVEKAVELGVSKIVPLVTSRSVARPASSALERLRRTVVEASKQCGRNRLAEIAEPQAWDEFLRGGAADAVRLIAHPAARNDPAGLLRPGCIYPGSNVFLAIGPEGGFTDDELSAGLSADWTPIDLGPRILRIETAAAFLVALVVQNVTSKE